MCVHHWNMFIKIQKLVHFSVMIIASLPLHYYILDVWFLAIISQCPIVFTNLFMKTLLYNFYIIYRQKPFITFVRGKKIPRLQYYLYTVQLLVRNINKLYWHGNNNIFFCMNVAMAIWFYYSITSNCTVHNFILYFISNRNHLINAYYALNSFNINKKIERK